MTFERLQAEVYSILRRLRLLEEGMAGCCSARDTSVVPTGNLTATNVQAALEELQSDIDGINSTFSITAGENLSARDLIYIAADGLAYKADANDSSKDAKAIVIANITIGNTGTSYIGNKVMDGFVGLTINTRYFLSDITPGGFETTVGSGAIVQQIGYAVSTTQLYFEPQSPIGQN